MAEIDTVIFDLGDVVIYGLKGTANHLTDLLRKPAEEIHKGFLGNSLVALSLGFITEDEYWRSVVGKTGWDIRVDDLKTAVRKNFQEVKGTREIIEELREIGVKLGLLSIHAREWVKYCKEQNDVFKLFHAEYYSYEEGISKPHIMAHKKIVRMLEADPTKCLFIDDKEDNHRPARELGMQVALYTAAGGATQLRRDMSKHTFVPCRKSKSFSMA